MQFFLSLFLFWLLLLTHCSFSGSLLHLITLSGTQALDRTALDEGSARHRDLYLTTHNTRNKQLCHGGIWTHSLSKWVAADPRFKLRGHWDLYVSRRGYFRFWSYISRRFIQCLHTNSGVVPQIRPRPLPFTLLRNEPVTGRSSPDLPT
jgi:hypothetical protein